MMAFKVEDILINERKSSSLKSSSLVGESPQLTFQTSISSPASNGSDLAMMKWLPWMPFRDHLLLSWLLALA